MSKSLNSSKEPTIKPAKKDDLNCIASIEWGNGQSELLKKRQLKLIERENWANTVARTP